jgi:predicted PurR-regulated permease PerM
MTSYQPGRSFFFLLLAATALFVALVVRPLAMALFVATVLAVVLWPVHRRLAIKLGDRPNPASALVVLGVALLLGAPLLSFSTFLVRERSEGLEFVSTLLRSEGVTGLVKKLPAPLERWATEILSRVPEKADSASMDERVLQRVRAEPGKAVAVVGAVASATGSMIFQATMMLLALYFLLLHGLELVAWLDGVLPLPHGQTRELLTEFKTVSYALVLSAVVTSGAQAFAALIGYLIAQVPHPLFFAALTFFVAFIPVLGAASVCLVAALILFSRGHSYMALFLALWGLAVVGLVDNLVKPMLISSGVKMSGAIVFFALVGGLSAFGTPGLFIGPMVVAFFLALLRIYKRDFKKPACPQTGRD